MSLEVEIGPAGVLGVGRWHGERLGWAQGLGGKDGGADWDQGPFGLKEVNAE